MCGQVFLCPLISQPLCTHTRAQLRGNIGIGTFLLNAGTFMFSAERDFGGGQIFWFLSVLGRSRCLMLLSPPLKFPLHLWLYLSIRGHRYANDSLIYPSSLADVETRQRLTPRSTTLL